MLEQARPATAKIWTIGFDLLAVVSGLAAIFILASGGFQADLAGFSISVRTAGVSIAAFLALAVLRGFLAPQAALLWARGETPVSLTQRFAGLVVRSTRRLELLSASEVSRAVLFLTLAALCLRAANAWFYYGYFCGDDVEIVEMAYAKLVGRPYAAWDLRCPLFPVLFIYPSMAIAHALGVSDTRIVLFAGRMAVVLWSVLGIPLAHQLGRLLFGQPGAAILAAFCVAFAGVTTRFSGSELPGPVAGTFILLAMTILAAGPRSLGAALGGGVVLGVAGSLRFSEVVFLAPACLSLLLRMDLGTISGSSSGRPTAEEPLATKHGFGAAMAHAFGLGAAGLVTMALLLGLSDLLYWNDPLHSTRAIVNYTLLEGQSSRGFQPWYEYLPLLVEALGPVGAALLFYGWWTWVRGALLVWSTVPLALLSLLPHKELRYLVPLIPLLSIVIGNTFWRLLSRTSPELAGAPVMGWRARWAVLVAIPAFLACQGDAMRFRRSEDAVDAVRYVAKEMKSGVVAFEQSWLAGGRLYLPSGVRLREIDTDRVSNPATVRDATTAPEVAFIGLRARTVENHAYADALAAWGFVPVAFSDEKRPSYLLFERRQHNPSPSWRR